MRCVRFLTVVLLVLQAPTALAFVISGRLNDPGNTALVASDLGAPSFVDDFEIANNIALHNFNLGQQTPSRSTATASV